MLKRPLPIDIVNLIVNNLHARAAPPLTHVVLLSRSAVCLSISISLDLSNLSVHCHPNESRISLQLTKSHHLELSQSYIGVVDIWRNP